MFRWSSFFSAVFDTVFGWRGGVTLAATLALLGLTGCGKTLSAVAEHGDAAVAFIDGLEASGADYEAEIYLPMMGQMMYAPQ